MNLYEKLFEVMKSEEVGNINKNMVVGNGRNSYKGVSEKAVLEPIRKLFIEHRLLILPIGVEVNERECSFEKITYGEKDTKIRLMTQVKAKYRIVDVDKPADYLDIESCGNGSDTQDKGAGKALTYALKIALTKTFLGISGEDTDNQHSDDLDEEFSGKKEMSLEYASNLKIGFGKYKDKKLSDVYKEDNNYFIWLKDNAKSNTMQKACKVLINAVDKAKEKASV
jgi:hypothetical protein